MHHPLPSELYTLSLHDALPISAPGIAPKPALDPRENQPFPRPRHAYIQETPRLFDLVFDVVRRGLEPRDLVILHADDVDARELEAFGRVQREEVDAIGREVDAFGCRKGDALEQTIDAAIQCSVSLLRQRSQPRNGGRK